METSTLLLLVLLGTVASSFCQALTFGVVGDFGLGGKRHAVQGEMRSTAAYNEACLSRNPPCNFTISAGDNIYVGDVMDGLLSSFENMYEGPHPMFPSVGNHDNWRPQVEYTKRNPRWKFPDHYYTYKLPIDDSGYAVQVFAVDTTDGSLGGGGQFAWLENALKTSNARWKLIFGHYPTTGSGRHRRHGTVGQLSMLMSKYNAQVYFCGHDHLLEISNVGGKVMPMSGAMSRGGMMLRGIGGGFRRFSLTQPGEFNKAMQDWPGHGFMTCELSPNVLTINLWDQFGNMVYEVNTVWDWLDQVKKVPSKLANDWPPADVVAKAYRDEMLLPKGTEGGQIFHRDGTITTLPSANPEPTTAAPPTPAPTTKAPPPTTVAPSLKPGETRAPTTAAPPTTATPSTATPTTKAPTTASPPTTPSPPTTAAPPTPVQVLAATLNPADQVKQADIDLTKVTYGLGTECLEFNCADTHTAYVGIPFTITLVGATMTSQYSLFLTESSDGCVAVKNPMLYPGTIVQHLESNSETFNVSKASAAYVCVGTGSQWTLIQKGDTTPLEDHFLIKVPGAGADGTGSNPAGPANQQNQPQSPQQTAQQTQYQGTPAPAGASSPTAASGGGTSPILVVLLCVVAGIGGAFVAKRVNWQLLLISLQGGTPPRHAVPAEEE